MGTHPGNRVAAEDDPAGAGEDAGPGAAHLATKVSQQLRDHIHRLRRAWYPAPNFRALRQENGRASCLPNTMQISLMGKSNPETHMQENSGN